MTLMDDLWNMWKVYIDYFVVGNDHLKKVFFHVFLGIILTSKQYGYSEGADKKSLRLHTFIIQDSGTGKSQTMKATNNLVRYLGVTSRYSLKDNEPALCGTIRQNQKTGEIREIKGLLHTHCAIFWDEGKVLLTPSRDMDVLQDRFQMVMDEPGMVSKGMALGALEYLTPATIVAGSFMFNEFRQTILNKGFLQRMFSSYKEFSEQEKEDMRRGVQLLKVNTNPEIIRKAREAIKAFVGRIPPLEDNIITFNRDDVIAFYEDMEKTYKQYVSKQFIGEKQGILETFFNRFHILIDKVATQRAIILGKKHVEYEDMKYALEICKVHLESLSSVFEHLKGEHSTSSKEDSESIVLNLLRKLGGTANQTQLIAETRNLTTIGKWDLGIVKTIRLLDDMIQNKKIHMMRGDKNAKILSLGDIKTQVL